jgi:hypothetical protein
MFRLCILCIVCKCVLYYCNRVSTQLQLHISYQRIERDVNQKCILIFMYSSHYSWQILTKPEFSGQIYEKYSDI